MITRYSRGPVLLSHGPAIRGWSRSLTALIRSLVVVVLVLSIMGCYNRKPVENHARESSRLDVAGREKEILLHLGPELSSKETDGGAEAPIRIVVRSGLLDEAHRGRDEAVVARALAMDRFRERYGTSVDLIHLTEADLVRGQLTEELLDGAELLLVPSYWLLEATSQHRLLALEEVTIKRLDAIRQDFLISFAPVPPGFDPNFLLPYFRTSYGIYYNVANVSSPPTTWGDCFMFEDNERLWDAVHFLDEPDITLSIAAILAANLKEEAQDALISKTDELFSRFKDLGANFSQGALQALRREFADTLTLEARENDDGRIELHPGAFRDVEESSKVSISGDRPMIDLTSRELDLAARLLQFGIIFGADFRDELVDPIDSVLEKWSMLASHSRDIIGKNDPHSDVHYVIPEEGTLIELEVLAVPSGLSEERLELVSKLIDFMILKPVAASLSVFSSRASMVPGASAFVPPEMVNSPVYTLPPRNRMHFLPLYSPKILSEHWEEVRSFQQEMLSVMQNE